MTETPTPAEIARWAALAEAATPGPWIDHERTVYEQERLPRRVARADMFDDAAFIAAAREAVPRLLALVAAQAEQNAELRAEVELHDGYSRADTDTAVAAVQRAERAEAELSTLRATDEYQRWARAVVERDAARERITKALQFVNHELADAVLTEFDHGAHSALAVVRAALDGTAGT